MSKFRFPDLKFFVTVIILNIFLFTGIYLIYVKIKRSGFIDTQRRDVAKISAQISSRIYGRKKLISRLARIDFIQNFSLTGLKRKYKDLFLQIETMKKSIGASVVFLLDPAGEIVLSSAYDKGKVLAGSNAIRPYFKDAMRGKIGFYGAIGGITGTRGFYFSSPVLSDGKIKYVLVGKFGIKEFDKIFERASVNGGLLTPDGVIFCSKNREWIIRTLFKMEEKKLKTIKDSRQFFGRGIGKSLFSDFEKKLKLNGNPVSLIYDNSVPGGWVVFSLKYVKNISCPIILLPLFFFIIIFEVLIYSSLYNFKKRRETQRKYDETSDRFRYLFQSALDSIFILDAKGIIVDINYAGLLKLGFSKDELIGNHFKRIVDKKSIPTVDKHIRIIENDFDTRFEFKAIKKSGSKILIDCAAVLLKNRFGETESYFAFCHDISKQREFENELKKAMKDAKNANRAKSEFLANMSHEIRTPMNAILGFTDIMKDSPLGKDQINYLNIIKESGRSLLHIIDDILDFSKIEAGKILFENVDMDIRKIVNDVINMINIGMNRGKVKIFNFIDINIPPVVKGDPLRLKQVLINLLSNAVKFTEKGDVKLEVKLYRKNGNMVSLYFGVSDTGIGIPKEETDKLFKPFSQIDSSSSRSYKGTGLGLVITSGLVKQMGGEIKVKSSAGKGALFYFVLSFEKSRKISGQNNRRKERLKMEWDFDPGDHKILIAEDQKVNSMLLDYILKKEGFKTVIAEDGKEAVECVEKERFDLILMDIQMPEMDGIEAAKRIKKMKNGNIAIIALTADAMKGDRERFIESGMDDYLEKPVERNVLLQTIRRWIGKK